MNAKHTVSCTTKKKNGADETFNHLAKIAKWSEILDERVYKIKHHDCGLYILTDVNDGTRSIVEVPKSEEQRIIRFNKRTTIYLKRRGTEFVFAVVPRRLCFACNRTFVSRQSLYAHRKKSCTSGLRLFIRE